MITNWQQELFPLQASLVITLRTLTWCQNDDNLTATNNFIGNCNYRSFQTQVLSQVLSLHTWVLFCHELSSIHELFCGELDACFQKEKAKKVGILLSLSCLSLNLLLQQFVKPQKRRRRRKMKEIKEQSCFLLGTREWVLHVDLHVCTVGTSIKISCYTVLATGVNVAHSQRGTWGLGLGELQYLTCTCHLQHVLLPHALLLPLALLTVPFIGFIF